MIILLRRGEHPRQAAGDVLLLADGEAVLGPATGRQQQPHQGVPHQGSYN